jgi:hypothetical protein
METKSAVPSKKLAVVVNESAAPMRVAGVWDIAWEATRSAGERLGCQSESVRALGPHVEPLFGGYPPYVDEQTKIDESLRKADSSQDSATSFFARRSLVLPRSETVARRFRKVATRHAADNESGWCWPA